MRVASALCLLGALIGALPAFADAPPPPPNAARSDNGPAEAVWFVSPSGTSLGPKSIPDLIEMAKARQINKETPVWRKGWPDWKLLDDVPDLQPVVAALPAAETPPPPPPNIQGTLEEKFKAYLAGRWHFEGPVTMGASSGYMKAEIVYRTDGSYAGSQSLQIAAINGIAIPPNIAARQGRWQIIGIDENDFVLRLTESGMGTQDIKIHVLNKDSFQNPENLNTWYRLPY